MSQINLYNGDSAIIMKEFNENSIDMIITSPPYDDLRTYNGYSFDFKTIANETYRVLKNGGVMVWIVGDATTNGSETLTSFKQALYFKEIGFNVHDTMIYQKNNFSNPSKTRYHQIFEYMFILSKGKPKTFNPIIDRKNACPGSSTVGINTTRKKDGTFGVNKKKVISEYGMRYNIWKGNTAGQENMGKHLPHPAMFPLWLINDHIISWSNENDVILDPFMGSGTTGVVCKKLNRNFIGIELDTNYFEIAEDRINESN